jgi:hypothetical protein
MGWPFREEDWRFALGLGRGIAAHEHDRLVATTVWWPYEENFASVGMIIVTQSMQGRGIGRMLMDELLRQTESCRLFLNSTREGYRLYEKMGFVPYGKVHQHQATRAAFTPTAAGIPTYSFRPSDLEAIRELDRRATGMGRNRLLDALLAAGTVRVTKRADKLTGFGCIRRFGRGFVIGPVVAEDLRDAQALIESLSTDHVGDFLRIDVTEACGLAPWLNDWGLPQVDTVVSMARGEPPAATGGTTLYAIASQSLG